MTSSSSVVPVIIGIVHIRSNNDDNDPKDVRGNCRRTAATTTTTIHSEDARGNGRCTGDDWNNCNTPRGESLHDDDNPLEGRGAMVDALAMMETIAMHHGRRRCAYQNYAWRRRSSWCGRCTLPCRLIGDATAVEGGRRRYAFGVKVASVMVVVTATLAFNDM